MHRHQYCLLLVKRLLLALQVFAVEARYEEGLFPLPAPREELLVLLEREWARCESKAHALADAAG